MADEHFIRYERSGRRSGRIHLAHTRDPRMLVEMEPDRDENGRVQGGVIRRVRFANSAVGDYQKYGQLLREAVKFFERTVEQAETVSARRGSLPVRRFT